MFAVYYFGHVKPVYDNDDDDDYNRMDQSQQKLRPYPQFAHTYEKICYCPEPRGEDEQRKTFRKARSQ